jgi:hypothetical protein
MVPQLKTGGYYALQNQRTGGFLKCYKDTDDYPPQMKVLVTEPESKHVDRYLFIVHKVPNRQNTIMLESLFYKGLYLTWRYNDSADSDGDGEDSMLFVWTMAADKSTKAQWIVREGEETSDDIE